MKCVYLRRNKVNGMLYVGQTIDLFKRERHWKCLKLRYGNQKLTEDREKYGVSAFDLVILNECNTQKELDRWEKHYIKFFNSTYPNGYNVSDGGKIAFKCSDETKKKISEKNKGENNGMYGKEAWNKGKEWNEETKRKISESLKGNKCAFGHKLTEDTKNKISIKKKGVSNTKLSKKVIQVFQDGSIKEWNSVAECHRNGYSHIDAACRGKYHSNGHNFKGCKWYYLEDYEKMLAEQAD